MNSGRPKPLEVFENPVKYMDFLTTSRPEDFESQNFDRKEFPSGNASTASFKENAVKFISGCGNYNQEGGLLVLGISNEGLIRGVRHLNERKLNTILRDIVTILKNHASQTSELPVKNEKGEDDRIFLIYVPYARHAICETNEASPRAWKRVGTQSLLLTAIERQQLERDKGVVDFENSYCCDFDDAELDKDIVDEFKKCYLEVRNAQFDYTTAELLRNAGALVKINEKLAFTKAGYLFFAANPQKHLANSYVRLLKFDVEYDRRHDRGLPTFDRSFYGPLPTQIRKIRAFLKDSAFFKTYSRRNPDGGFTEESEYPFIAVDEAIVNAIIHRDYGVLTPIQCSSYRDVFAVINAGGIPQSVPDEFNLSDTDLASVPRNPKIVDWMRLMKDERGHTFVRALSEGTKTMQREMANMSLPSPFYKTDTETLVVLRNNYVEREAKYTAVTVSEVETNEFTNLFPVLCKQGTPKISELREIKKSLAFSLKDALSNRGWFIDRHGFSRIVAHERGKAYDLPEEIGQILKMFPAFVFQFRDYGKKLYLCVDYKLEIKNFLSLEALKKRGFNNLIGKTAVAYVDGKWITGKLHKISPKSSEVWLSETDEDFTVTVTNKSIIPDLSRKEIVSNLREYKVDFDFDKKTKELSFASQKGASRRRVEKTNEVIDYLDNNIFPIRIEGQMFHLDTTPRRLTSPCPSTRLHESKPFTVFHDIKEPAVEFYRQAESRNILEGLTTYGAYEQKRRDIEIVPICTSAYAEKMEALIDRLQHGKYRYHGTERTFGIRLKYHSVITPRSFIGFRKECERLLTQNPEWEGNNDLNRLFLVYVPEKKFPQTDSDSPYYDIKRLLFRYGIPVQMVDSPTLENPDFKDLNLALNIIAKCGGIPWVLPDELPDVDFFVGLSYTQRRTQEGLNRILGFANVFNNYGRWKFYNGSVETFDYEDRHRQYAKLIQSTMERLQLSQTPSIHFHYSAKFSKDDIGVILHSARKVRPNGRYTFVWINTTHIVRLYDFSVQSDGSLSRASYVVTSPQQFYLSTTGYNVYKKALGTPIMLEINVRAEPIEVSKQLDLKTLAKQLLYLTKLNWASTQSLCGLPITIKYAGDIARLTSRFMEKGEKFELHPVLRETPWFI